MIKIIEVRCTLIYTCHLFMIAHDEVNCDILVLCAGVPEFCWSSGDFLPAGAGAAVLSSQLRPGNQNDLYYVCDHILDIVCCNMIMFCKIGTKYLFLLAFPFSSWIMKESITLTLYRSML